MLQTKQAHIRIYYPRFQLVASPPVFQLQPEPVNNPSSLLPNCLSPPPPHLHPISLVLLKYVLLSYLQIPFLKSPFPVPWQMPMSSLFWVLQEPFNGVLILSFFSPKPSHCYPTHFTYNTVIFLKFKSFMSLTIVLRIKSFASYQRSCSSPILFR